MSRGRRPHGSANQPDLFSSASTHVGLRLSLARAEWPPASRLPINHAAARVHDQVWDDLVTSRDPLVVAGYASIENIVALIASLADQGDGAHARVLLGTEPFVREHPSFGSPAATFTEEVRRFWTEEQGISLSVSAKLVQTIEAMDAGRFAVRFVPGGTRLHAKIFLGDEAATLGSSNFTHPGMRHQFEANVRFDAGQDAERYNDVRLAAENYWRVGQPWDEELKALLRDLLRFVPWREALARACADLLEGQWAARYLQATSSATALWPSQVAGIAEALWVVESVGSVLVADATGSGKTRMGAHLARAVRDRLWSTGRVRRDLTVLVCPPAVEDQWRREATSCGLNLLTVSQGLLSRAGTHGPRVQEDQVARAQILAIDEAHNFLSTSSNRTAKIRQSGADHVVMFTATPINRGAEDLLALVDLLGADNFDDRTLLVLDRLARKGNDPLLTDADKSLLRDEIQRFTVRRTKTILNAMVARDEDAYRHPDSGRVCRYPEHVMKSYATGESAHDEQAAATIRTLASGLRGLSLLGEQLAVPAALRKEYDDARWLDLRVGAARGLAAHHVLSSMRSSKAALLEYLIGTVSAATELGIATLRKAQASGDVLNSTEAVRERGLPRIDLDCDLPPWLADEDAWRAECDIELEAYRQLLAATRNLTTAREEAKADQVRSLSRRHERVLAFDHHPITLAVIESLLDDAGAPVTVATGGAGAGRKHMTVAFARDSNQPGIGLCSDAMNEGINLQGASAVVQLDMPTTLRVAEQRVGRVDRMDSRYDRIEVWWPDDGPAFATRANELLAARSAESSALLGSNLPIPDLGPRNDAVVTKTEFIEAMTDEAASTWDGIRDALDPVRQLVEGEDALLTPAEYELHRTTTHRVLSRVSPVQSTKPWAFFAISGTKHGAPRWLLLEGPAQPPAIGVDIVADRLRELLAEDPADRQFDSECEQLLSQFIARARAAEVALLPRRAQRALTQMNLTCRHWAARARRDADFDLAERWEALARVARVDAEPEPDSESVDLYQVADAWYQLVQPLRDEYRQTHRRRRYITLSDLDQTLRTTAIPIEAVESALGRLEYVEPVDRRISACILGVPDTANEPL